MLSPDDAYQVREMLGHAQLACRAARGRSRPDLDSDRMFQVSCKRFVAGFGEAAAGLSDPFKAAHADIPWHQILAVHNALVHGAVQVDLDDLWDLIDVRLPALTRTLEQGLHD